MFHQELYKNLYKVLGSTNRFVCLSLRCGLTMGLFYLALRPWAHFARKSELLSHLNLILFPLEKLGSILSFLMEIR